MDPAFRSLRQAGAFAALLLACLASPLVLGALHVPRREAVWSAVPEEAGPFSFIHREVMEARGDVDLLFIGSSYLWAAIDVPYVEQELGRRLGRKATVLSLSSNWLGEDLVFVLLRDLLARRKVSTVVFMLPSAQDDHVAPHPYSAYWFTGDDVREADGLPLLHRAQLYAERVIGWPRQLLGALRGDLVEPTRYDAVLGAALVRRALPGRTFAHLPVAAPVLPAEELIYSPATRERFRFAGAPLTGYAAHFARKRVELARAHGAQVVLLNVPRRSSITATVKERLDWPAQLGGVPLVGVPAATLFAGLTEEQIDAHFYNEHLNLNGAERFTRAVTPALLALHERPR